MIHTDLQSATPNKSIGYRGMYPERGGESARQMVEVLARPPEFELSGEQKAEVYTFENDLFDHEIEECVSIGDSIRAIRDEIVVSPLFFAQAFIEGQVHIQGRDDLPRFSSDQEVYEWIAVQIESKALTPPELQKLAKDSSDCYIKKMSDTLVEGDDIDMNWTKAQALVIDPENFVKTAQDISRSRDCLLELRKIYKEGGEPIDGAKRAVVDMYLSRLNGIIAENIPVADYLVAQAKITDNDTLAEVARQAIHPGLRESVSSDEKRQDVMRRLDFLRNGMGLDKDGKASAVSASVEEVSGSSMEANVQPYFTLEQTRLLKETMVSPEEMLNIIEAIIKRAGMLSSEPSSTWSSKREVRAADGLFQVVINPDKATFEVNGKTGVYKVASQPRSLYELLVVGGFHELTHINQAEIDQALSQTIRLASLKGKRPGMLRESGANVQQRAAELELFGAAKPVAMTYAEALKSLEHGENIADATRAFYNEKRKVMPSLSPEKAAKEAADRVIRLIRAGGRNSTAMSYAEGGLFEAELAKMSPEESRRGGSITSFDLVDQMRLHRYGLLPEQEGTIDWKMPIQTVLMPYIVEALSNSSE